MARACKCKVCRADLKTDNAYKVSNGKINSYYCTKEEYDSNIKELQDQEKCFQTVSKILNEPFTIPMMKNEINKIHKYYSFIVIERTFLDFEDKINWCLNNKQMKSEYAKTKYIVTIIANNINSVQNKYKQEQKDMAKLFEKSKIDIVDVDIMNIHEEQKLKTKRPDISDFLD
ncbi:hypothetical protein [Clostridium tagluense]|uniref:Uncharacterized protein n=1 Tax=Clostridium tagluense TaxID=360422 RepID=A0A401UQ98_9CLOT|nr:hypothetical protein [Clostridium tagluense]GCD11709.1 hypothetical protein Ctaglu_33320 [Clostridium tagluense]